MPTGPCTQVAGFSDAAEQRAMELYLFYVLSSELRRNFRRDAHLFAQMRKDVGKKCVQMPFPTSVQEATIALAGDIARSDGNSPGDTEAEARALLSEFLKPGADYRALTLALQPSEAEIRAIFAEPLASRVQPYLDDLFAKGTVRPKPGQTEILIVVASSDDINAQSPIMGRFPGGYKRLAGNVRGGFPVVRFKFVEPGKTLGMAFDGLYKVGDHWVFIPKAWRLVKE